MKIGQPTTDHAQLSGLTANNHHNQAHGATDHTNRTIAYHLQAGAGVPNNVNAVLGSLPAGLTVAQLRDAADEGISWLFMAPQDMVNGVPTAYIDFQTDVADAGNIAWRLNAQAIAVGTSGTGAGTTTSLTASAGNTLNSQVQQITFPISLTAGVLYRITLSRAANTDAASDTAACRVDAYGLNLFCTRDQ